MRAVITVIGKDSVGIVAKVSNCCSDFNANVIDVTQTVLQDMFAMIMLVDISKINNEFQKLSEAMKQIGEAQNLSIHVMHENIFNAMHTI